MAVCTAELLSLEAVTAQTAFCHCSIPELGLVRNFDCLWRVYILACEGGRKYCGIEHRSDLERRMLKHMRGEGAEYTRKHQSIGVLLCWPVPTRAGEAYVFAQMLELQSAHGQLDRIGGWVQTSVNPSPLQRVVFEEQRRQLRNRCFRCGLAGHYDEECRKPREGAPYRCPGCRKEVIITSRGQSLLMGPAATESPIVAPPQEPPMQQQQAPAQRPTPPLAPVREQQARKRPASAVSVGAALDFDAIWEHPTGFRRRGNFGSLADLLRLMDSAAAQRAAGRPGEKVSVWSRRWAWRERVHYKKDIAEFANRLYGGGPGGMGLNKQAAQQVYEALKES
jgi:hypothetical protein